MHHHRSLFALFALALLLLPHTAQAQDLDYYFPEGTQFDQAIPSPAEFLGYNIGEYHTRHDRLVAYFRELERHSDLITVEEIGLTNQHRPMIYATITSESNHANLENLRHQHLQVSDPGSTIGSLDNHPIVVQLGYGVHGNETSSSEVAMLQAYHLVAGQGSEVERYLDEGIFLVEPVLNPDGRDRHTHWANTHRGQPLVADPLDREHNEVWPGGRTNHYWFDLNRDWLPLTQVESQHRLDRYHDWMPNVVTDFHEMGTGSTYFFEPTEAEGSWNQLVPEEVYTDLTEHFADNWARVLDDLGTIYFTEEVFDNSYPGYGSTYPNMQGGIGFVFEQASARGHLQDSPRGEVTFPYTIRNQLRTSLATVETSIEQREELLQHQRNYFTSALDEASEFGSEAYVFGDAHDTSRNYAFIDLLLRHNIDVYELNESTEAGGRTFAAGGSWVVPTGQPQYRMVRSMFEKVDTFADSTFYDTSAWSMALAYGLPHAEVSALGNLQGSPVTEVPERTDTRAIPQASVAYLLDWSDFRAARALYALQDEGLRTLVSYRPFEIETNVGVEEFARGSIVVPVQAQDQPGSDVHEIVQRVAGEAGVPIRATSTSLTRSGSDLGSRNVPPLEKPEALTIIGNGISSYEAGQVWYTLDEHVNMPITKVDVNDYNRVDLNDYSTLVLVSGNYNFLGDDEREEIQRWVRSGGTLITIRGASQWAVQNGLVADDSLANGEDEATVDEEHERFDFETRSNRLGAQQIGGNIYEVDLDITHPLGFGYTERTLPVYRDHRNFFPLSSDPYSTVAQYTDGPHLSGYVSEDNLDRVRESASLLVDEQGSGRVILFVDNPNFRGMWLGTNRLFFNALFFGGTL